MKSQNIKVWSDGDLKQVFAHNKWWCYLLFGRIESLRQQKVVLGVASSFSIHQYLLIMYQCAVPFEYETLNDCACICVCVVYIEGKLT